jgi:hypothetical protein
VGEHLRRSVLKLVSKLLRVYTSREASRDIVLLLLLLVLLLVASPLLVLSTSSASVSTALIGLALISSASSIIICSILVVVISIASSAFGLLLLLRLLLTELLGLLLLEYLLLVSKFLTCSLAHPGEGREIIIINNGRTLLRGCGCSFAGFGIEPQLHFYILGLLSLVNRGFSFSFVAWHRK